MEIKNLKLNKLKIDFHVHSVYSKDSKSNVRGILERCVEVGLNGVAITDHDTIEGSMEAIDILKEEHIPLIVVPGMEVSTLDGHLLAYCINKNVDSGMSMIETALVVKKLGGFTVVAHPFQFYRHGIVRIWKVAKYVDAFEIKNAKYILGVCNLLSTFVARYYKKPGIAGSDAHKIEAVGSAYTEVFGIHNNISNCFDIFNLVINGNTRVCGGRQKFSTWIRK